MNDKLLMPKSHMFMGALAGRFVTRRGPETIMEEVTISLQAAYVKSGTVLMLRVALSLLTKC